MICLKMNVAVVFMPLILIIIDNHYGVLCDGVKKECFVENGTKPLNHRIWIDGLMMNCHSLNELQYLLQMNNNNSQFIFYSMIYTFHFHLELFRLHNVSFVGHPSIFSCSDDAGLMIVNSVDISITNITFEHCGVLHNGTSVNIVNNNSLLLFRSAVYILNSTDIRLESVTISHTNGIGLAFIDTDGSIDITNCTFANNSVNQNETEVIAGGGGVYIEFTYCWPSQYGTEECDRHPSKNYSVYKLDQTKFTGNIATSINRKQTDFIIGEKSIFLGLGRGGGLNVVFRGAATNNTVILNQCQFVSNSGVWGGGLKVTFRDEVTRNSFVACECVFDSNQCLSHAGGGADVGFSYFSLFPHKNKVGFYYCNFTRNIAEFGGGLAFYSSSSAHKNLNNTVEFEGCIWSHNRARYGSAVDIGTHAWATIESTYLPSLLFKDSVFMENYVNYKRYHKETVSVYKKGNAAFLAITFTINFFGTINFTNNNGSALVLVSSVAIFQPYTNVIFHNNSGFNGGAIALIGFSVLTLSDNMFLILSKNEAIRCGGAIYSYSIDAHNYVSSRTCFFQSNNVFKNKIWVNSSVIFVNNKAGTLGTDNSMYQCGHSIYATTLLPCFHACKKSTEEGEVNLEETFKCFANFTFSNNSNREYEVTTSGANFIFFDSSEPLKIIPSKEEPLPVALVDDLGQRVNAEIFLNINGDSEHKVQLNHSYVFLSNNKTVLYGKPGAISSLTLSTTMTRESAITLRLSVERCPPGYISSDNQCICSAGTEQFYSPVYSCDNKEFVAIVRHGYWIGYVDGETEDDLLYSYCPGRCCFCDSKQNTFHKLTRYASRIELDKLVCGCETTGILCSSCKKGYTFRYHSIGLVCSKESCKLGWLFYIASELLPITALFLIVMILNIEFATGELNGFIFFAQVFDSLTISVHGLVKVPKLPNQAVTIARLFYRFFNYDFFRLSELSFCLWSGANSLDMLAFKYVTVAYALFLIAITVWLMNKCNLYQRIYCLRASTTQSSIIHGLSAFLVMIYTKSATVSLKILGFTYLYSKGHKYNRTVVTYQGDMPYLQSQHLPYAIPALVCVIFLVVLPSVILMIYPSCFRVVSLLHLGDKKCVSWMIQRIPHAYLKPFADSFQSCFKDNLRFFAGLYFVYRLTLLILWQMSGLLTQRFILLEILFVSMLLVHSIFQPYKKRWHNILDSFIFFVLSGINGITIYNYHYAKIDFFDKIGTDALIHIQVFLAYLPLSYFVTFTVASIVKKVKNLCKLKISSLRIYQLMKKSISDDELPFRLKENAEFEKSDNEPIDYQVYNEYKSLDATY